MTVELERPEASLCLLVRLTYYRASCKHCGGPPILYHAEAVIVFALLKPNIGTHVPGLLLCPYLPLPLIRYFIQLLLSYLRTHGMVCEL